MKKAILVASFGTTHLDTLEKTILPVEQAVAAAYPDIPCFRAFTSPTVRRRLKERFGMEVDSVEQALDRLARAGFTQVDLLPTLLLPGEEYNAILEQAKAAPEGLRVSVGLPLLWEDRDLAFLARTLVDEYPMPPDTVLLAMGHGTSHEADGLYLRLREYMTALGMELCTVEGSMDFDAAVRNLLALPQRKVHLVPLLLVAGEHSKNDMAGPGPESLRSLLTAAGFEVSFTLKGLGELPAIRRKYVQRLHRLEID